LALALKAAPERAHGHIERNKELDEINLDQTIWRTQMQNSRILIVDDDPNLREALGIRLRTNRWIRATLPNTWSEAAPPS
jgi:hypothetical protein